MIDGGYTPYLLATVAFVVLFGLFWLFSSSKKAIERWEGVLLLVVYLLFIYFEFSKVNGHDVVGILKNLISSLP